MFGNPASDQLVLFDLAESLIHAFRGVCWLIELGPIDLKEILVFEHRTKWWLLT